MVDIARAVRGISTGYLRAKVADTAEQDKLNQEFILAAKDQYYNVDKPQFMADEKKRSANIDFISTKLSPVYANYADVVNPETLNAAWDSRLSEYYTKTYKVARTTTLKA